MPTPSVDHDRVHQPRDDPRWRESYYFSWFDWELGIGGFSSIGKRPSKGHSGSINALWGPAISTLVASEFDKVDDHRDEHLVAGMRYAATEPFGPWQLSFQGQLNDGGDDVECRHEALGPTGRSPAPKRSVSYELTFTPDYAPYLYEEREEFRDLFDGHIDEVGTTKGWIEIDGQRREFDGRGAKDHSWGVRDWFKPQAWRWMDVLVEDGPELALWGADFGGTWVQDGAIYSRDSVDGLSSYRERIQTTERPRKPLPAAIELEAVAGDQELKLRGDIVRAVPIFFGRDLDGGRETSWNDRTLVRGQTGDGASAWANVEFETLLDERRGS